MLFSLPTHRRGVHKKSLLILKSKFQPNGLIERTRRSRVNIGWCICYFSFVCSIPLQRPLVMVIGIRSASGAGCGGIPSKVLVFAVCFLALVAADFGPGKSEWSKER